MKKLLSTLFIFISTLSFASDDISSTCRIAIKEEIGNTFLQAGLKVFNNGHGVLFIKQKIKIKGYGDSREGAAIIFSTKEWPSISDALDKCIKWGAISEKNELEIEKNVYECKESLVDTGEKINLRIDFLSKRVSDKILKTIPYVSIKYDCPELGNSRFLITIDQAKKLSSMFKSVPGLEIQVEKAAALLK